MASLAELRAAIRAALVEVFGSQFTAFSDDEWLDTIAEQIAEHVQPHDEHLDQIAALSPLNGRIIVGDGSRWVLGDACDCVQEHVDAEHPHAQYMREADAIERFAAAEHEHAYEAAGTMDGHLAASDPHPGRYDPAGTAAAAVGAITPASIGAAPASHTHAEYAPVDHHHDDAYEAAGTMSTHLAATNPHGLTPGSIGAAAQLHVHPQYQATSQKGAPNGYASLDGSGRVPASQLPAPPSLPVAYASTSTTADAGPASGTYNPFAGRAVVQHVEATGITYNGSLGRWTVADGGVYEVSVVLPVSVSEAGPVTLTVAGHVIAGLVADPQRRPMAVTVLRALTEGADIVATVAAGGTSLVSVGAGATVSIRRIA